jgi:asparagine synthase (glutamine-hydrolysing)
MARHSSRPVNTYSIGYAGGATEAYYNELSYAKQVAQRFGTNHTEIPVVPQVAKLLPKLLWHIEEPISDSAMLTTYLVSELAAKSVKVILSGVGGDELFAGYRRYLGEHYNRRYRMIPAFLRKGVLSPLSALLPSGRQNKLMDLSRYARKFIQAAELDWRAQYRLYLEIAARSQVDALLGAGSQSDSYDTALNGEHAADELLRLFRVDAATQLPEDLLLLTDKITMATSIECRVPFLDQGLVELAATIPAHIKMPNGELKGLLKRALEGVVPHDVLYRSKRGFGAPVGEWLKRDLLPMRNALLSQQAVEARGLVAWPAVQRVIAQHDGNREDYSDLLFVLLNLELWCRLFLDGRSADDLGAELSLLAGGR